MEAITDKIMKFVSGAFRIIGDLWMPVWTRIQQSRASILIIAFGIIALFALGILLHKCRNEKEEDANWDKYLDLMMELPSGFSWASMLMKVFYPPMIV